MANAKHSTGPYFMEGIGYDFLPSVFQRKHIDEWVKTNDNDSFHMAREVIKKEGLLVGGSCGATVSAALKAAKCLKKGQKCVVIFADSSRNYLTKFLDDGWMKWNGFMDFEISELGNDFSDEKVSAVPIENSYTIGWESTCGESFNCMIEMGIEFVSVLDSDNKFVGVVQKKELRDKIEDFGEKQIKDCLKEPFLFEEVAKLNSLDPLSEMVKKFSNSKVVAIFADRNSFVKGKAKKEELFLGLVEKWKLWRYTKQKENK